MGTKVPISFPFPLSDLPPHTLRFTMSSLTRKDKEKELVLLLYRYFLIPGDGGSISIQTHHKESFLSDRQP